MKHSGKVCLTSATGDMDTTGKYPKAGTFFLRPRLEFTKGMLGRTEDDLYYNQLKRTLESNVVNFTKLNTTDRQNLSASPTPIRN